MDHPAVDAIVAERLENDVQTVQLAALDAIAVRQPSDTLSKALEHAAQKAEKSAVRLKAVRILGEWLPKRPEVKMILGRLSRQSEHVQVREAAQRALGG
jgi:hypothetical protein